MPVKYKYDMDAIETEMYAIMGRGVMTMKIKDLFYAVKPPCPKCPYTLGQVHTLVNPCPECRVNGYRTYEQFQKKLPERPDNTEN